MQITERTKTMLVVALAIVFAAVSWWRLGGKGRRPAGPPGGPADVTVGFVVPTVDPALYQLAEARPEEGRVAREIARNPFAFPIAAAAPLPVEPERPTEPPPAAVPIVRTEYQLRGILRSSSRTSADINGRLYSVGERVGRYTVADIGVAHVTLTFVGRTFRLGVGEAIVER